MVPTFLLRFQEKTYNSLDCVSSEQTKTLTETRESSDQDSDRICAGTQTKTSNREQSDPDFAPWMKTGTETAVRQEQSDEDQEARAGYRAVPLPLRPNANSIADIYGGKIKTGTAVREQADQYFNNPSLGTQTFTLIRNEQVDDDANVSATYRALPLARHSLQMGTLTVTKTAREASDQDSFAAAMGTQTCTRAREGDDQDKSHRGFKALPVVAR